MVPPVTHDNNSTDKNERKYFTFYEMQRKVDFPQIYRFMQENIILTINNDTMEIYMHYDK